MAISSIRIDEKTYLEMSVGPLELPLDPPLEMKSLGRVVVLAGPNGAGKTRLLRLVENVAKKHLSIDQEIEVRHQMARQAAAFKHWEGELNRLSSPNGEELATEEQKIAQSEAKRVHSNLLSQLQNWKRELLPSQVMTLSVDSAPKVVAFCPKQPKLVDPGTTHDNDVEHRASRIQQGQGSDSAEVCAPAYARRVLRAALWAKSQSTSHQQGMSSQEIAERELQELVTSLLGPNNAVGIDESLNVSIGGYRHYPEILSQGQQILFQFACLLHAQGASLANCVVLMDEPENHLHPAALAQVVEVLSRKLTTGQIWIATHSVPLIAQLAATESDSIWYVNEGKAKRAGRSPELVLDGLMGGPAGSKYIQEFTQLPAQYAALNFLSECMNSPGVAGANVDDPQTNQIAQIVGGLRAKKESIRIVDFGAGTGRLLATLRSNQAVISGSIDYYAFDPSSDHTTECLKEIDAAYGGPGSSRLFHDLHKLTANIDPGTVDLVVMCNVFHEIEPDEWLSLFGKDGFIRTILSSGGYLLLVEDYGMPVGERAHRYGFLMLDEEELIQLFGIREVDRNERKYVLERSADERYRDRLKAHLIGSDCVMRISPESQLAAIRKLHDRMTDRVQKFLHDGNTGSSAGRAYALDAQLLANSSVWLKSKGKLAGM